MLNIERRHLIAGLIVILLIVFFGGMKYADLKQEDPVQEIIGPGTATAENQSIEAGEVQVYVTGEVEKPGLYKLKAGARVFEALEMAGVLPGADLKMVQPARKLQDGETIEVLTEGQNPADTGAALPVTSGYMSPSPLNVIASPSNGGGKVNINTASVQELDNQLPGIGPTLAQRIVDYRSSNGPFNTIDDLNNVSGIGDKKFAGIKDLIIVR